MWKGGAGRGEGDGRMTRIGRTAACDGGSSSREKKCRVCRERGAGASRTPVFLACAERWVHGEPGRDGDCIAAAVAVQGPLKDSLIIDGVQPWSRIISTIAACILISESRLYALRTEGEREREKCIGGDSGLETGEREKRPD
ncbi:hypothetical protein H6P81_018305 [Aristolochia fimbriata]|uniref:Uncharacterized protein n=1 Tax=Aristolochia fimbriata TaxID=158543 RepID=A0AAV7E3M1_ARIFI|nr:hypothetical protein H6P81_018305 [Aristolochia fimbriata]